MELEIREEDIHGKPVPLCMYRKVYLLRVDYLKNFIYCSLEKRRIDEH